MKKENVPVSWEKTEIICYDQKSRRAETIYPLPAMDQGNPKGKPSKSPEITISIITLGTAQRKMRIVGKVLF